MEPLSFERFCESMASGTLETKQTLYGFYSYGVKERQRYRDKDKRRNDRIREEKKVNPPVPKKRGRPVGSKNRAKINNPPASPSASSSQVGEAVIADVILA